MDYVIIRYHFSLPLTCRVLSIYDDTTCYKHYLSSADMYSACIQLFKSFGCFIVTYHTVSPFLLEDGNVAVELLLKRTKEMSRNSSASMELFASCDVPVCTS